MNIVHRHHIVPRHAGGTEEESNLFPLSVTQHALAHRNRWILVGDALDWIAWKSLSGQISTAEASALAKKTPEFRMKKRLEQLGKAKSSEHRARIGKTKIGNKYFFGKHHTDETKQRISEANAKKCKVTYPDGTTIDITNLLRFCANHELNYNSVRAYKHWGRPYRGFVFEGNE